MLGPGIKVRANVDTPTAPMVLAHRPVLVERSRPDDAGLVDARALGDGVGATVLGEGAEVGRARRGVVGAKGLDNVVLDQRVLGPAVDGQVAVARGVEATREVNGAGRAGVPRSPCESANVSLIDPSHLKGQQTIPCQQQSSRNSAIGRCRIPRYRSDS